MKRLLLACLMLFPLSQAAVSAEDTPAEEVQSVDVAGIRNPELRSYRKMMAGLDAFDSKHQLAPAVDTLRFRLKPKYAGVSLDGVTLRIAGGETSIQVPVGADGTFVLPRDQAAFDSDADLLLNRKQGQFSGMPHIRSPNVPAGMRRLGDIRLECQVAMAIFKTELNFALRAAATVVMAGTDWCQSSRMHFAAEAPWPSDSVTLVSGTRREVLQRGRRQKHFDMPITDRSWPDDTLVEFQPAAPISAELFTAEPLYVFGTMNKWSTSLPLRQAGAGRFSVDVTLPKKLCKFQIASKDMHMVSLGAFNTRANETRGYLKPGMDVPLDWDGKAIWFEPPEAGTFTFTVDVSSHEAPVLTITARAPSPGA